MLTKIKGKAVKLLSLFYSKYRSIHGIISMYDFEKGIFPWDVNSEDDSENESSTCKFFIFSALVVHNVIYTLVVHNCSL